MEYKHFKKLTPAEKPQVTVEDVLTAIEKYYEENKVTHFSKERKNTTLS